MDLGLSSKVVLLTGGTSGIGLEAAREFLQEGASVCLMGRSEERGREAAARLAQEAGAERICFLQGDVKSVEDCGRVVKGTVARFGRLDVLVNSATHRQGGRSKIQMPCAVLLSE